MKTFFEEQAHRPFTYPDVGATATTPPAGYTLDHTRIQLGRGQTVFDAAVLAINQWKHFDLGWVSATPAEPAIRVGAIVAVSAFAYGLWWLNACRIVYLVDDQLGPIQRFGFAYGTLPAHAEMGEERFLIEWNQAHNTVAYDILAFSKPRHVLARIGYPLTRRLQRRFAHDSTARMLREVTKRPRGSS